MIVATPKRAKKARAKSLLIHVHFISISHSVSVYLPIYITLLQQHVTQGTAIAHTEGPIVGEIDLVFERANHKINLTFCTSCTTKFHICVPASQHRW